MSKKQIITMLLLIGNMTPEVIKFHPTTGSWEVKAKHNADPDLYFDHYGSDGFEEAVAEIMHFYWEYELPVANESPFDFTLAQ